jgi:hypothetical protein
VAYVERVEGGRIRVSEAAYDPALPDCGDNQIPYRGLIPATADGARYIHRKSGPDELGGRMMIINGGGAAYAKDNLSPGGWSQLTAAGDAKAIAVGSSGRMMVITGCGAAYAKDSVSSGGWIQQTGVGTRRRSRWGDTREDRRYGRPDPPTGPGASI